MVLSLLFPDIYETTLLLGVLFLIHSTCLGSKRVRALKRTSRIMFLFGDEIQPRLIYLQNLVSLLHSIPALLNRLCSQVGMWYLPLTSLLCTTHSVSREAMI